MAVESTMDADSTNSPTSTSPWVAYLTGKREPPYRFLQDMAEGVITVHDEKTGKPKRQKAGKIIKPDEEAKNAFVDALIEKPDRVERLMLMMQALNSSNSNIHGIVMDLAERSIKRLGIISSSEPVDATNFSSAISLWLAKIPEKPLKSTELTTLFLLLHLGRQQQWLDYDLSLKFIALAVSKSTKSSPIPSSSISPDSSELDLLLAIPVSVPVLIDLLAYFDSSKTATTKLNTQIQSQTAHITQLTAKITDLEIALSEMRTEIAALTDQRISAATKIEDLETQIISTRASYQHRLDDIRGRVRGTLQGQITRWLQTSLDAARTTPPKTQIIEERIEEALKLIEKEIQWLQPSG